MLHAVKILVLRLAIMLVAVAGFIGLLSWVHDYPQTRQAISDYEFGDGMLWLVSFYFINEAGSGIKYEITGNPRHLGHYPRMDFDRTGHGSRRDYEVALYEAQKGIWKEQLRVSHMYALGWGVDKDMAQAAEWYQAAEQQAADDGDIEEWENSFRRKSVRAFILPELGLENIGGEEEPWRETGADETSSLILEGGRG